MTVRYLVTYYNNDSKQCGKSNIISMCLTITSNFVFFFKPSLPNDMKFGEDKEKEEPKPTAMNEMNNILVSSTGRIYIVKYDTCSSIYTMHSSIYIVVYCYSSRCSTPFNTVNHSPVTVVYHDMPFKT